MNDLMWIEERKKEKKERKKEERKKERKKERKSSYKNEENKETKRKKEKKDIYCVKERKKERKRKKTVRNKRKFRAKETFNFRSLMSAKAFVLACACVRDSSGPALPRVSNHLYQGQRSQDGPYSNQVHTDRTMRMFNHRDWAKHNQWQRAGPNNQL